MIGIGAMFAVPSAFFGAPDDKSRATAMAISSAICIIFIGLGLFLRQNVFRCYRNGVESKGRFTRFEDVTSIRATYQEVTHAVLRGVDYTIELKGHDAQGEYLARLSAGDLGRKSKRADFLIRAASATVGRRMLAEIAQHGKSRWTPGVMFGRDLISFDFWGIDAPTSKLGLELLHDKGELRLSSPSGHTTNISFAAENFYPGLFLLADAIPRYEGPVPDDVQIPKQAIEIH
jgi:hypothetical protein